MPKDPFPLLLPRFFGHLRTNQAVSPHTLTAYRDTLRLLLLFIAERKRIPIDRISFEAVCPQTILSFLEHLQKERHNTARTRNARLAAIRAFVRFALQELAPDFMDQAQRILAIPSKRFDKPLLAFLSRREVTAILEATDRTSWTGRRDHLLFSFLYNTGARISEALQITPSDLQKRIVRLHGKGRKQREVPLWPQTYRELEKWCHENQVALTQPIFGNRESKPLSRREAARRLVLTLQKASGACPSLRTRKITLHSWRHTCAMHLLQAGVAVEIIALWLGHEQVNTTHGYIQADLTMKKKTLDYLKAPKSKSNPPKAKPSHILTFLEAL